MTRKEKSTTQKYLGKWAHWILLSVSDCFEMTSFTKCFMKMLLKRISLYLSTIFSKHSCKDLRSSLCLANFLKMLIMKLIKKKGMYLRG